ncbi:hypothetical protein RFI_35325 [Reticulomyxa filosa]|uniref:Uncharacterized protein n=1 Tax=Reticulomyxa filosa TaxID=46433 RepID=X6LKG1_RETFI|nr:hypothetical protein RFI_35325 [Reticulomyxa filosa]|eukprot:ETO02109.1 hypothetical protein RFI_35325 [Reticulomyxa filosa]
MTFQWTFGIPFKNMFQLLWTHGEPSLMIDDIGQQLDDNKLPKIYCALIGFGVKDFSLKRLVQRELFLALLNVVNYIINIYIYICICEKRFNPKDNNKTDANQDEEECVPYVIRSYESSHWYNDNGLYAYSYDVSSPSYNPYNNNSDPMAYVQQLPQLLTLNPCGYLSDSDTTVRDDIVPSPPFASLALINGGTPLTSQPQTNIWENQLHKEEGYDQSNEWEHEYLNLNDMSAYVSLCMFMSNVCPYISKKAANYISLILSS